MKLFPNPVGFGLPKCYLHLIGAVKRGTFTAGNHRFPKKISMDTSKRSDEARMAFNVLSWKAVVMPEVLTLLIKL